MVRISALTWDRDAAPAPRGEVRYLFDRACYLRQDGGSLVAITDRALGILPGGLSVDLPEGVRLASLVKAGSLAATRGGILRFEGGFAIDLRTARRWGPTPSGRDPGIGAPCRGAIAATRAALRLRAQGAAPDVLALIDESGPAPADLRHVADRLVGRGPGLTPAGDDYIVGLAAGLDGVATEASRAAKNALTAEIVARAGGTTDVSRILLDGAARRVFPERLVELADVLCGRLPATGLYGTIGALAAIGHSSGIAMGLGLVGGLSLGATLGGARLDQRSYRRILAA